MLGAIANTVKATGGEGKEMVPDTPLCDHVWTGTQIRSSSLLRSTHLITTQPDRRPFVFGRRGAGRAEWRCVDFDLGSARGAWGKCVRGNQGEAVCGVRFLN